MSLCMSVLSCVNDSSLEVAFSYRWCVLVGLKVTIIFFINVVNGDFHKYVGMYFYTIKCKSRMKVA